MAAKAVGYPATVVGKGLAQLEPNAVRFGDIAAKLYGESRVPGFAHDAGISTDSIFAWKKNVILAKLGVPPQLRAMDELEKYKTWHDAYIANIGAFATVLNFDRRFQNNELLDASKNVLDLSWGGVADFGKHLGYGARQITEYLHVKNVSAKDIGAALQLGGFSDNEAVSAVADVYHVGEKEAKRLLDGAQDVGKKACKTMFGWTKLC